MNTRDKTTNVSAILPNYSYDLLRKIILSNPGWEKIRGDLTDDEIVNTFTSWIELGIARIEYDEELDEYYFLFAVDDYEYTGPTPMGNA